MYSNLKHSSITPTVSQWTTTKTPTGSVVGYLIVNITHIK